MRRGSCQCTDDRSSDLRTKSVVAALWSKENFNYHPAVMPSPARRTLTGGIHYSARAFKLSTDGRYKRLFEECPFDEDWRYTPMIEVDPIMSGVYWFENANKDRDLDEYETWMRKKQGAHCTVGSRMVCVICIVLFSFEEC